MPEPSDLERTIEATLRHRSDRVRPTEPRLDAVFDRVDARRRRRRAVAGIGSMAAVGVGVLGIATLGDGGAADLGSAGAPDSVATTAISPTTTVPTSGAWLWACSTPVTVPKGDPQLSYFRDCFQIADPALTDAGIPQTTTIVFQEHVVRAGDSLASIAAEFGVGVDALAAINGWDDGIEHPIVPGDVVRIPDPGVAVTVVAIGAEPNCATVLATTTTIVGGVISPTEQRHTVIPGDSLVGIGELYGVDPGIIANYNLWGDCGEHAILPGDVVLIPPGAVVPTAGQTVAGPPSTTTTTTAPPTTIITTTTSP